MANLKFILQYILKPRTTGAVLPSSKFLAQKMTEHIDYKNAHCIVEYGPGTGVFTEKILQNRHPGAEVFLLEPNGDFCRILREKFANEPNLHIIEDTAANIGRHISARGFTHADCIISGLPFASLPPQISESILRETKKYLAPTATFTTFQYTLFKKKIFARYFEKLTIKREFRNVPPAYVLIFYM